METAATEMRCDAADIRRALLFDPEQCQPLTISPPRLERDPGKPQKTRHVARGVKALDEGDLDKIEITHGIRNDLVVMVVILSMRRLPLHSPSRAVVVPDMAKLTAARRIRAMVVMIMVMVRMMVVQSVMAPVHGRLLSLWLAHA